jgi:hypothetical protein
MRGLREILAHPAKKPMGHPKTSGICRLPVKDRIQNNNEPPCPREFLAQPTKFEKSEVLQQPLASPAFAWKYWTTASNWTDPPAEFELQGPFETGSRGRHALFRSAAYRMVSPESLPAKRGYDCHATGTSRSFL